MRLMDRLHDPDLKRDYTRKLFSVVAPKYFAVTRALSFFRDAAWKKCLLSMAPRPEKNAVFLDMACGSGDITLLLGRKYPACRIVGCDLSFEMLGIARRRLGPFKNVELSSQDMARLGIRDASVDLVTGGYALRNAPDIATVIAETVRILKPGGSAAFLDFSKSIVPCIAAAQCALLFLWGGMWGLFFHGRPSVYAYIGRSLAIYPDWKQLHRMFEGTGFVVRSSCTRMFGLIRIDVIQKKEAPEFHIVGRVNA